MNAVTRYDAMLAAIAEAKAVDEVKDIVDKAEAMRVYARQAKNREAEIDAAEIRIRAERRLGELITAAKEAGQVARGRPGKNVQTDDIFPKVKLSDAGIDRNLSSKAQELAAIPDDRFAEQLAGWRTRQEDERGRVTAKLIRNETKREHRKLREIALAEKQAALPEKRYGVILADPPWRNEPYSRETGMDRAADNHYTTQGTATIAGLPVPTITAPDCVLFIWATMPMLEAALFVLEAWGFKYKSHCVWAKPRIGTGYWFRQKHELLLVATRGKIPAPAPGDQFHSVIEAPVGEHSVKPERFYEIIESYFPSLAKMELYARKPRAGWDCWGDEVWTDDPIAEEIDGDGESYATLDDVSDAIEDMLDATDPGDAHGELGAPAAGDELAGDRAGGSNGGARGGNGEGHRGVAVDPRQAGETASAISPGEGDQDPFSSLTSLRRPKPDLPDIPASLRRVL